MKPEVGGARGAGVGTPPLLPHLQRTASRAAVKQLFSGGCCRGDVSHWFQRVDGVQKGKQKSMRKRESEKQKREQREQREKREKREQRTEEQRQERIGRKICLGRTRENAARSPLNMSTPSVPSIFLLTPGIRNPQFLPMASVSSIQ